MHIIPIVYPKSRVTDGIKKPKPGCDVLSDLVQFLVEDILSRCLPPRAL